MMRIPKIFGLVLVAATRMLGSKIQLTIYYLPMAVGIHRETT